MYIYAGCSCGMGVAYYIAPYSTFHTVTACTYFTTVTDCEPGLSSVYGDMPLTLQVYSQSCDRHYQTQ